MKNKFVRLVLIVLLLASYPTWRYISNAKAFALAIINHSSVLGKWTYGSISSGFDGEITIRNVNFNPHGYRQSFDIESITIATRPMFLFKNSAEKLNYMLPEALTISVNTAILNSRSNDVQNMLKDRSMWMLMAGFAGSFGCSRDSFTSFGGQAAQDLLDSKQVFNLDLYYSRQSDGSIDADLILDAENQFSTTWSSNLKSGYSEQQFAIDELLIDKLFYYYLDNGFNLKRNNICKQNYKSSFATYRLSSAQHLQEYIRTYYLKELPATLINLYQRLLAPNVEYSAIISLDKITFLSDFFHKDQIALYENSMVEISSNNNKYMPISFAEVDYTKIDTNVLKQESIKRQKREAEKLVNKAKQRESKYKPVLHKIGTKKVRKLPVSKLKTAINKKLRIKTKVGRPILGYLREIDKKVATIESKYKSGTAIIALDIKEIASIEIVN